MAATPPTYDLTLLLDTAAPDDQRQKVLDDVERIIVESGTITNRQDWGARQTAYEIGHKKDAEYHLVQFHGGPDVLATLQRTLRIADGLIRFRIIKLKPGTPAAPESRPEPRPTGVLAEDVPAAAPAPEPVAAEPVAAEPVESAEPLDAPAPAA